MSESWYVGLGGDASSPEEEPAWRRRLGPSDDELGAGVATTPLVARTDDTAVAVTGVLAHEAALLVRVRAVAAPGTVPPDGLDLPLLHSGAGSLLVGVEFADGRRASTAGDQLGASLHQQGGSGGSRAWDQDLWLTPLPPPGPLTFVVAWPARGLATTRLVLDAAAGREAAERAVTLWPPQPEPRAAPPQVPAAGDGLDGGEVGLVDDSRTGGPRDHEVAVPLGQPPVLARSGRAAVDAVALDAGSTGFRIRLTSRLRPPAPPRGRRRPRRPVGGGADGTALVLEYADGRRASTRGDGRPPSPEAPWITPLHGSSSARTGSDELWVTPLPPSGPVTVAVSWPEEDVPETRGTWDGAAIAAAGRAATVLWPWDPETGLEDGPVDDPELPVGWFADLRRDASPPGSGPEPG